MFLFNFRGALKHFKFNASLVESTNQTEVFNRCQVTVNKYLLSPKYDNFIIDNVRFCA